ncbi:MAG: hypothetical protein ACJ8HI_02255 [Massilia sp.]
MRPLSLLLSASILLLPAIQASAQSTPYPSTDQVISTVEVPPPPQRVRLDDSQIEDVCGQYAMSNGWRLKVEPSSSGISAKIDRQRPMRLIAVAPDKFVSRDGNVVLQFNPQSDRGDMTMSYVPDARTAQVVVIGATSLAQR